MKFLPLLQVVVCFGGLAFAFRLEGETEDAVDEFVVDDVLNRSERTNALVQGNTAWQRVKVWRCHWFVSKSGIRRRRICTHRRRGSGSTTNPHENCLSTPPVNADGHHDYECSSFDTATSLSQACTSAPPVAQSSCCQCGGGFDANYKYEHHPKACMWDGDDTGIEFKSVTIRQCAEYCDAREVCQSFKYVVNHGASEGGEWRRCVLNDRSVEGYTADCAQHGYNMDLYIKTKPVPTGYTLHREDCVDGSNLETLPTTMTSQECADHCNVRADCKAFEFGTNYNGDKDYHPWVPGGCILQSAAAPLAGPTACRQWNVDIYVKNVAQATTTTTTKFFEEGVYAIKGLINNKFARYNGDNIACDREKVHSSSTSHEKFDISVETDPSFPDGNVIRLKSFRSSKFCGSHVDYIKCNKDSVTGTVQFILNKGAADGVFGMKSVNNAKFCTDQTNERRIQCKADNQGPGEWFEFIKFSDLPLTQIDNR